MLTPISIWPTSLQLDNVNSPLVIEKPLRDLPKKRLVCCGHWQQKPIIAKLYLDPHSAIRHWKREREGVIKLQKANITTPELLFSGLLEDKTPVLLFEELPDVSTALDIWTKLADDQQRLIFLQQLLLVLLKHHHAGLQQKDLHLNNFLYSKNRWHTIDADTIEKQPEEAPLSLKKSLDNLALFFAQLPPEFDYLIESALVEYTQQRQLDLTKVLNPLNILLEEKRKHRRHKYIKKSYRTCSEFIRHNSKQRVAIYRRDADPERIQQLLADPDALMATGGILKDGNSATVTQIHHPLGDWVIKRYNIKNFLHGLKRCLRPSRAWVSWGNAQRLSISGIATPQAIAVIEKRLGSLRLGAYYICEHIPAPDAAEYFQDQKVDNTAAQKFITLFKILRYTGIYHGDCKATNFLINNQQPWVIDLDAMREFRSPQKFLRHYSIDRKRFLQNWQGQLELRKWFDDHLPK